MTLKEYIKKHPYNSDGDNIIEFLRHDIKLRALVLSQLARDVSIDIQLLLYENESKQRQLDEQNKKEQPNVYSKKTPTLQSKN